MTASIIHINGEKQDYQPVPLADYLQQRGIAQSTGGIAVAVNNNIVPRGKWPEFMPQPGDQVEIITAVSGG